MKRGALTVLQAWCVLVQQHESPGETEWISTGMGLLLQPSACLPSSVMMIYGCSLCPDLVFQTHVRCGSLRKAFTINKQTLFTWLILWEAMRLKHLEQDIHLPRTAKYHPDAIDIYWPIKKQTDFIIEGNVSKRNKTGWRQERKERMIITKKVKEDVQNLSSCWFGPIQPRIKIVI